MLHPRIPTTLAVLTLALSAFSAAAEDLIVDLGRGPVTVTVPSGYEPGSPLPLILVLHGYGGSHTYMESWWQMAARAEEYGFFVAHPDGTVDTFGSRFWNATDACCNFGGSSVDDSQYLLDLIDEIASQVDVDPARVYVCGHSNGGFMSHRMACDHPDRIAAIASMAGATFEDPLDCDPASPVHALQIHGTADGTIFYGGGSIFGNAYPGAVESTEYWAGVGECVLVPDTDFPPMDLDGSIPGEETVISQYADQCDPAGSGELWTIQGGSHSPSFNASFSHRLVEWFLAHPKPEPADVESGADLVAADLLTCVPSPFRSSTSVQLRIERTARVAIEILTPDGRRVRTLSSPGALPAGVHSFPWDGRDGTGRALAAGIYFVRARIDGDVHAARVVQLGR